MQEIYKPLRVLLLLYVGLVIYLSIRPTVITPNINNIDKAEHLAAYSVMSLLSLLSFSGTTVRIVLLLGAIGLGSFLECVQSLVPGRQFSLADGAANTAGVLTGLLFFYIFNSLIKIRRQRLKQ